MNVQRYALFQIGSADSLESTINGFDAMQYSLFKHGCVQSTHHFARLLASRLALLPLGSSIPFITASAYLHTPTAASLLLQAMLQRFVPGDYFRLMRLYRDSVFPYDYACLETGARQKSMQAIRIHSHENLEGETVVVIDDAYVSGAHENLLRAYLAPQAAQLIFVYLVDLSQCRSALSENHINRVAVRQPADMLPLMQHPEYALNSRALKLIMSAGQDQFRSFLACLQPPQIHHIYQRAIQEGYHQFGHPFAARMAFLEMACKATVLV